MPKTGRKGEMLGRIFSHVENRGSILGHKRKSEYFTEKSGLIQEIVSVIADFFSADSDELMTNIINQNKQLKAMMDVVQRLQTAA